MDGYQVFPGIPWRRYFARCFDLQLAVALIGAPVYFLLINNFDRLTQTMDSFSRDQLFWFIGLLSCIIYLFIEACIIKLTGTTFGKFSLGILILSDSYDRNYTYGQLLKRDFLMFLKGLGLNIPVANIIALFLAKHHVEEDKEGQASWDYDCRILISYKKLGRLNYFLIAINALFSIFAIIGPFLI